MQPVAIPARVDVTGSRRLALVFGAGFLVVLCAVIIGPTACPEAATSTHYFAYECDNNSHLWDPDNCHGVQMSNSTSHWVKVLPSIDLFNRFWIVTATPYYKDYTNQEEDIRQDMIINVSLSYREASSTWSDYVVGQSVESEVSCPVELVQETKGGCISIPLIVEQVVRHPEWLINVNFVDPGSFIGDVKFSFATGNTSYSMMQLAINIVFVGLSAVIVIITVVHMRKINLMQWNFDQRFLLALAVGLLLFDNPFYSMRFLVASWFFLFLDSVFGACFSTILLLYWLFSFEKARKSGKKQSTFSIGMKLACASLFFVFVVIMYSWRDIVDKKDPIFGTTSTMSGALAFMVLGIVMFLLCSFWAIILGVTGLSAALKRKSPIVRFIFLGIPSVVVALSEIAALFEVVFNPKESATEYLYFLVIKNVFVCLVTYGLLPPHSFIASHTQKVEAAQEEEENVAEMRTHLVPTTNSINTNKTQHNPTTTTTE
ncbi:transmembrane protein [Pelomyxa schiedti]|nr:transmembrane protein [Pelomyxa schiedti]